MQSLGMRELLFLLWPPLRERSWSTGIMHEAGSDAGGSVRKEGLCPPGRTSLAAAPSARGWGAVETDLGCQSLKTLIIGAVMGFRGYHVLHSCPLPLLVHLCFLLLSQYFPCKNQLRNAPLSCCFTRGAGSVLLTCPSLAGSSSPSP